MADRGATRVLGIIPARGGSKAVPRKNLRPLAGRPLLLYSIDAASQARSLDAYVVSTEDAEIAAVARSAGAPVSDRPPRLAGDDVMVIDVVLHVLDELRARDGRDPEIVVVLHPTSPFRTGADIDACVDLLRRTDAPAVITVSEVAEHPYWMHRLVDGRLEALFPDVNAAVPRQQLPVFVFDNGMVLAVRSEAARRDHLLEPPGTRAIVTDRLRSIDIDSPEDFRIAEAIAASELR